MTKFGAVAVPRFAALKPSDWTAVLLMVLVTLKTSKLNVNDIRSRTGNRLLIRESNLVVGSIRSGLLGSHGTRVSPSKPLIVVVKA